MSERLDLVEQLPQERELHAIDSLYSDYYGLFSDVSEKVAEEIIKKMCILDAKHKGTSIHSIKVSAVAFRLAKDLGTWFNIGEPYLAARSGLLHDIGKFYIDSTLLDDPKNENKEWIKAHPGLSKDCVDKFDIICAAIIAKHHSFQKGGYPEQLSIDDWDGGNELLVMSGLIAIADQVTACRETRYSRLGYSSEEAFRLASENLVAIPNPLKNSAINYANEIYDEIEAKIKNPRFNRIYVVMPDLAFSSLNSF